MPFYVVAKSNRSDVHSGPYTSEKEANHSCGDGERVIASSDWLEVDE